MSKFRIESLLSARLFLAPQITGGAQGSGGRIYFISNLSGHLSLYAMRYGGSVPEPLLPPNIALQNPELIGGLSFLVYPKIGKIVVMIDQDGDENYRPMLIPLEGGFPEPLFGDTFANTRVHMGLPDIDDNLAYFVAESRESPVNVTYRADIAACTLTRLAESKWGYFPASESEDHSKAVLVEGYTIGDVSVHLWKQGQEALKLLYGVPLEKREPGQEVPLSGINGLEFTEDGRGLLVTAALFTDAYGPAFFDLEHPESGFQEVKLVGAAHQGAGEMIDLRRLKGSHVKGDQFLTAFNIDGASWLYEAEFDRPSLTLRLIRPLVGIAAPLANGVLEAYDYDKQGDRYILSFSTATSPTQIYTIEGLNRERVVAHTSERVLGIPDNALAPGEDASFVSFDGTRVSARLYLPAPALGYQGLRPLVYYIHGGPQGQERPNFAWFSMPLIQYLTLNGFAVFVPNVRGSTGYGLRYTKQVDHDWGGQDRLDHVEAIRQLANDPRVDVKRAGVVGRSYGGYMTLTLAGRHPELWSAAVDMFGPYDLMTFSDRIPETWKPYMAISIGDPVTERDFLVERSPRTHIDAITAPLLVIQGKNDPRVVERESRDLVEHLREQGKLVEYLMFENEGHDVLKYENRVRCYNAITEFFTEHLKP